MKKLLSLLLILFAFASCNKEDSLETQKSYYPSKTFNASHKMINDYQYNSDHKLILANTYDTLGNKVAYYKYFYENNRMKEIQYYSRGTLTFMTTYEYNLEGNVSKAINYNSDTTKSYGYSAYEYDLNKNVSKVISYRNNLVDYITRYSFDNGDISQAKYYDSKDSLRAVLHYTYDDKPHIFSKFPSIIPRIHNQTSMSSPNAVNGVIRITMGSIILSLGQTYNAIYTYDNNGLAVTKSVIYDNLLTKPEFYSYEYIQQ